MGNFKLLLKVILVLLITQNIQPLEQVFRPCPRNNPHVADCVKNSIELLTPQIATGMYGSLKVDHNLSELHIGDVSVNRNLNLKLSNLIVKGMNNFKIQKLRINPEKFKLEIIVFFPHVEGQARYNLRWNLGVFALEGNGPNMITLDNITGLLKLTGTRHVRNGIEYLKIDNTHVTIKAAELKAYFGNLFNGQKNLERTANDVINQNIDILKGDVFPVVEQVLGKILLKISNQIFSSAPFGDFFPAA